MIEISKGEKKMQGSNAFLTKPYFIYLEMMRNELDYRGDRLTKHDKEKRALATQYESIISNLESTRAAEK
jgi:hypothetical protein